MAKGQAAGRRVGEGEDGTRVVASTCSCTAWEGKLGKVVSRFCLPDSHPVSIQEWVVGRNYAGTQSPCMERAKGQS